MTTFAITYVLILYCASEPPKPLDSTLSIMKFNGVTNPWLPKVAVILHRQKGKSLIFTVFGDLFSLHVKFNLLFKI